jgi:hypothetical protein
MKDAPAFDLVVLVPDRNTEAALSGILARPDALGIRPVTSHIFTHPERDPGCYHRSHDYLRPMLRCYRHALVVFDRAGSGRESEAREILERRVEEKLARSGWGDRAAAVVVDPELEAWVWSPSPRVAACLGWPAGLASLVNWLTFRGLWPEGSNKPPQPKQAVEAVLYHVKKPRSSALYARMARTVSLQRCADPAFLKLKDTLQKWFPP